MKVYKQKQNKQTNLLQNTEKLFLQLEANNSLEICKTNPMEIKNLLLESQEIFAYVAAAVQSKSDTIINTGD